MYDNNVIKSISEAYRSMHEAAKLEDTKVAKWIEDNKSSTLENGGSIHVNTSGGETLRFTLRDNSGNNHIMALELNSRGKWEADSERKHKGFVAKMLRAGKTYTEEQVLEVLEAMKQVSDNGGNFVELEDTKVAKWIESNGDMLAKNEGPITVQSSGGQTLNFYYTDMNGTKHTMLLNLRPDGEWEKNNSGSRSSSQHKGMATKMLKGDSYTEEEVIAVLDAMVDDAKKDGRV